MNIKVVAKTVVINSNGEILLLRRSKTDPRRPGQWDFPGGNVEKGEFSEQATVREIFEESGIAIEGLMLQLFWADARIIEISADETKTNLVWLFYYVKISDAQPKLSYEHDSFQWIQPSAALRVIEYALHIDMLNYALENKLFEA